MDLSTLDKKKSKADPLGDPLAGLGGLGLDDDDEEEKAAEAAKGADLIHIRVQQRNGRKCITTVQGLNPDFDFKKIVKAIKKAHSCNGTIVEDDDMGPVLQFQGDQRDAVATFLTENELAEKAMIKKHGTG